MHLICRHKGSLTRSFGGFQGVFMLAALTPFLFLAFNCLKDVAYILPVTNVPCISFAESGDERNCSNFGGKHHLKSHFTPRTKNGKVRTYLSSLLIFICHFLSQ
jgi:hypothetical protein